MMLPLFFTGCYRQTHSHMLQFKGAKDLQKLWQDLRSTAVYSQEILLSSVLSQHQAAKLDHQVRYLRQRD
jgi:hypothetical protein